MGGTTIGRIAVRWALPLLLLACGLAVLTLPAGAARTDVGPAAPVVIVVDENVSSADAPAGAPPALGVSGNPGGADSPPGTVSDLEAVIVSDGLTLTPPSGISDDESVGVSDAVAVTPPGTASDTESVGVADAVTVLPAASAGSNESVGVTDSVSVVPQAVATVTVLTVSPSPALAGVAVQLRATVTENGQAVNAGTVTFDDGPAPLGAPIAVDSTGHASFAVSSLTLGTHTITAMYSGTPGLLGSSGSTREGIYDYSLSLAPLVQRVARGATATFAVSSVLVPGSATVGVPSTLILSGAAAGSLGLPGSTTVSVPTGATTPDGPETVTVSAAPGGRTASATIYVDVPPTLHLPGAQSVDFHDALSFGVSATDPDAGDALTLAASGLPAGLIFTDNGNRTGTVSGTDTAAPGTYVVSFSAGDGYNAPVTGTVTIAVQREESTLTYTGASLSGSTPTLSALLREDGTTPIAGRVVTFTVGPRSCSAMTSTTGTASCAVPLAGLASAPISAVFAGDVDYLPSSAAATFAAANLTCANQAFSGVVLGNVAVAPGAWCDLAGATVSGNVQLSQASGVSIRGAVIQGNLDAGGVTATSDRSSPGVNQICATTVNGNLQVHDSAAAAPWNIGACGANTIGGNLQFQNNAAIGSSVSGNTVRGNLQCTGNAALVSSGNLVHGVIQGQCAGSKI